MWMGLITTTIISDLADLKALDPYGCGGPAPFAGTRRPAALQVEAGGSPRTQGPLSMRPFVFLGTYSPRNQRLKQRWTRSLNVTVHSTAAIPSITRSSPTRGAYEAG
jgi:hypothetical protein